jgi:hypothetical protein
MAIGIFIVGLCQAADGPEDDDPLRIDEVV